MATTEARQSRTGLLAGRSPLLRFQSDERLIALIRAGNDGAFELLFERYRSRLLAFCRHMLGSKEDAEDVLQEVFAASYNAIRADERDLHVRPWLYRIARNRCLNHLRRPRQDPRETMDDQLLDHGTTTADLVHKRADFRHLLDDIQKLPETQRTALLLRELDALSYEQIAHAMDNTVPSVKSLLVRARMSLAEAAESRRLSCADVRLELAEIAEGLKKMTPPIRRHARECEQCREFRTQLKRTSTAMAIALPLGPIMILKKLLALKFGAGAAAAAGGGAASTAAGGGAAAGGAAAGSAAAGAAAGAATAGGATAGGIAAGGAAAGVSAVATKAVAVTAATALLAGGAVEVRNITTPVETKPKTAVVQPAPQAQPETGGQSADTLPPVPLVQKELAAAEREEKAGATGATASGEEAAAEAPQPGVTGATGATGVTGGEGTTGAEVPAPVSGNGTQPQSGPTQTGGAALPPSGTSSPPPGQSPKPAPKAGAGTSATGASGPTAAPPAPVPSG